jgi:hypothetical protein
MLVGEAATLGVPSFWGSAQLLQAVPEALLHRCEDQPPRHLRLTVHHALIVLVQKCPAERAAFWVAPVLARIVSFLPKRLEWMWAELGNKQNGAVQGAQVKQTEEEIIQEVRCRG